MRNRYTGDPELVAKLRRLLREVDSVIATLPEGATRQRRHLRSVRALLDQTPTRYEEGSLPTEEEAEG